MKLKNVVEFQPAPNPDVLLKDILYRYIREIDPLKPIGDTHRTLLHALAEKHEIGKKSVMLTAKDIIDHAIERRKTVEPQTVLQDMTYLRGPLKYAKAVWKIGPGIAPLEEAWPVLEKYNLVWKGRPRTRRPSSEEIAQLQALAVERSKDPHTKAPMHTIIEFAIYSCRRRGEITRLRWEDFEEEKRMLTVRDMKDPKHKVGNHHRFPLLGRAFDIVKAQPMTDERIFPYNANSIGQAFIAMKHVLGIEGLRFHDLRREGITRLLEAGYTPQQVKLVSGHKTIVILDRVYSAMNPESLHNGPQHPR